MNLTFAPFGDKYNASELAREGLELEFSPKSKVRIGNSYELPCSVKTAIRDLLEVNAFSYINGRGRFSHVRIGRYCSIAESVAVGYPEHPTDWLSTSPIQYLRPAWVSPIGDWKRIGHETTRESSIGHDVWIGVGAFIRSGISIGTGAVIGAHAVVTKNVDPYSIVAGNPARLIRYRVPEHLIPGLLESRWWEYSPVQLSGCPFNSVADSLKYVQDMRNSSKMPYEGKRLLIKESGAELIIPSDNEQRSYSVDLID